MAFRETIEAMHADGLRLFVDVGARGNLAGFVEDILRGKPAFAMAANLPRRGGLTQLNHLVAATFAQGAPLKTDYLYARRRPRAIDWDAPEPSPRAVVELKIGFPEMRLSDALVERFGARHRVSSPAGERATADSTSPAMHRHGTDRSTRAITTSATAMGSRTTTPRARTAARLPRLMSRASPRKSMADSRSQTLLRVERPAAKSRTRA